MSNSRKCTQERRDRVCEALINGHPRRIAARAAGIGRESFRRWYNGGALAAQKRESHGTEALTPAERDLALFHDAVDQAETVCEMRCTERIAQSAVKSIRTALMWLRHRRPEDWNPNRKP
ncbi:MAG: hypothetical protein ACLQVD_14080 [Capsulimonadaceae bacterium]